MNATSENQMEMMAKCRQTFAKCMETTVYCLNERHLPADDSCVRAFLNAAEACYSCLNYSQHGSAQQREALHGAAEACERVLQQCGDQDDARIQDGRYQCSTCLEAIQNFLGTSTALHESA